MQYDLVFEGGGAKGMVFVGALQAFEARGHTYGRLLGTSAGAITATLLAAGYAAQEMLAALNEKVGDRSVFEAFLGLPANFDAETIQQGVLREFLRNLNLPLVPDFIEDKLDDQIVRFLAEQPRFRHLVSFFERGGWFSADSFLVWMCQKLDAGSFKGAPRAFSQMTLAQFYAATQVDLSLIASDTTAGNLLVLNHRTAPDCPVVWAVRMSMNIPLLWQEVIWQQTWGLYRGDRDLTGHVIVDGGMLSNFPMELFVSSQPEVIAVMGPKVSDNVLGFLIDDEQPVPGAPTASAVAKTGAAQVGMLRTVQRIANLLNTMMQAHDKMVMEAFADRVVRLPAQGYGTTEFAMSDERKTLLVAGGQEKMRDYLARSEGIEMVNYSLGTDVGSVAVDRMALRLLK
ncbi:MAG TPA: patatin-like phospholipase family protein [Anaerolineae bacterium]|nr:patatin-like phospholipase family protein [Anaerolineae bacterium]